MEKFSTGAYNGTRMVTPNGARKCHDNWIFHHRQIKLTDFVQKNTPQCKKIRNMIFLVVKQAMDTCLACKACASQCQLKLTSLVLGQNFSIFANVTTSFKNCKFNTEISWRLYGKSAEVFQLFYRSQTHPTAGGKSIRHDGFTFIIQPLFATTTG